MKEVAVQFGEQNSLTGVLTLPDEDRNFPVVVITTVGFTTKFGPARVHTQLARRLAEKGIACLRYDLDSLGDSGSCYAHISLKDRTLAEVGHALDFLQNFYGKQEFILAGICSGAEASFRRSATDERVVGAIMVDPFSIKTPEATKRYFFFRLKRKALLMLGKFAYYQRDPGEEQEVDLVNYTYMQHPEVEPIFKQLLERDIYIHMVYTATVREDVNHPGQLQKAFPNLQIKNKVIVDWLPNVTHSPIFVEQVQTMMQTILDRLENHLRGVR